MYKWLFRDTQVEKKSVTFHVLRKNVLKTGILLFLDFSVQYQSDPQCIVIFFYILSITLSCINSQFY